MSAPEGPHGPQDNDPPSYDQYGRPTHDQPPWQQPPYGQPSYEQPGYQQPQYGQPPAEQPRYDPEITLRPPNPNDLPYGGAPYGPDPYAQNQYGQEQYPQGQYGQEQYGQEQYGPNPYGAPAGYPYSAPPQRSNRTPVVVAVVAALVVAVLVVGIVLLTGNDDDKNTAQTPPPTVATSGAPSPSFPSSSSGGSSSTTPPATSATPSAWAEPTTVEQIRVPPVITGWQGVYSYKDGTAYDVPPDWKVESPGTLVGFEDKSGKPLAVIHGVSTYKDEACPAVSGSYRGRTGFKTTGDVEPLAAARAGSTLFARSIALKDDGTSAPYSAPVLKNITVNQGKIAATYSRITVTLNTTADCGSPTVVVVAVAFRTSPSKTAMFIGYFDGGVAGELPLTTAEKIFTTLRPYSR